MTIKTAVKTDLISNPIIFSITDTDLPSRIAIGYAHNFVDVVSLDGAGEPVLPTTGFYDVYVKTQEKGGFKLIPGSPIEANLTGELVVDGDEKGASFAANPIEIKVVPNGVDVAVNYSVTIRQNLT